LQQGDLILSVNRRSVADESDFKATLEGADKGDTILLKVARQGHGLYIAFDL
jgi:S1-C subfamily serine protease